MSRNLCRITIAMFKRAGVEAYDMKELRLADKAVTPLSKRTR